MIEKELELGFGRSSAGQHLLIGTKPGKHRAYMYEGANKEKAVGPLLIILAALEPCFVCVVLIEQIHPLRVGVLLIKVAKNMRARPLTLTLSQQNLRQTVQNIPVVQSTPLDCQTPIRKQQENSTFHSTYSLLQVYQCVKEYRNNKPVVEEARIREDRAKQLESRRLARERRDREAEEAAADEAPTEGEAPAKAGKRPMGASTSAAAAGLVDGDSSDEDGDVQCEGIKDLDVVLQVGWSEAYMYACVVRVAKYDEAEV